MSKTARTFLYYMSSSLDFWGYGHTLQISRVLPFIMSTSGFAWDSQALKGDWYSVGADLKAAMIADVQKKQEEGRKSS